GIVTWAQTMATGMRRSDIGYLVRRGAWDRLRRGFYAETGYGAPEHIRAALLATGNRAVASHGSAATLLGLSLLRETDPAWSVLTVQPGGRGHRDLPAIHVHRARLPPEHVTVAQGQPVTTVARTLVDLTRSLCLRDGLVAMDAALHADQVTLKELEAVLADCRGWPWIRRAAAALELADPAAESALESLSRLFFRAHDIPSPQTQIVLRSGDRFIARTDFWWASSRVAGEADGLGKYAALADLHAEKLRQERIEALGIKVVRWTWDDIWRPSAARATAARLRAALSRAA
ncbi:MAG: type IV toxin-antitoxin system AbiEi family antitoxin domain-containing protein, partial [Geodermatophilaceae bacterium]|nr:type IV toxin-antitoxin system AbiEi family antitoxin domain-containing protein [Geodermatophilaceae bacterium]